MTLFWLVYLSYILVFFCLFVFKALCSNYDITKTDYVYRGPWRKKWQPTPVFLPGESHGQRSLADYSPWGHKQLVLTEQLSTNKWNNAICNMDVPQFSSVQSLNHVWLCDPMDTRLPCPSPTPKACSNSCPSSQWCHPTISSSVVLFSSCFQSFPAWGSYHPMTKVIVFTFMRNYILKKDCFHESYLRSAFMGKMRCKHLELIKMRGK